MGVETLRETGYGIGRLCGQRRRGEGLRQRHEWRPGVPGSVEEATTLNARGDAVKGSPVMSTCPAGMCRHAIRKIRRSFHVYGGSGRVMRARYNAGPIAASPARGATPEPMTSPTTSRNSNVELDRL